jgi:hypothetical protein
VFDQQLLGNELGKRVATYYQVMAHKIHKHMWNHLSQNTRTNVEPSLSCAQLIFLTKIKKICETLQNRNLPLWGSISFKQCRVFFFHFMHLIALLMCVFILILITISGYLLYWTWYQEYSVQYLQFCES